MRYATSVACVLLSFGCKPSPSPEAQTRTAQPKNVKAPADNALRVMLRAGLTDYFVYRGKPRGFEHELLRRFARQTDRRLSLTIANNDEEVATALLNGEVDLWVPAQAWTSKSERWQAGPTYAHTDSVVVGRKGERPSEMRVRPASAALEDLTRWCAPPCKQRVVAGGGDWKLLNDLRQENPGQGIAVAVNRRHGSALTSLDPSFEIIHGMGKARPVRWWVNSKQTWLKPALERFFAGGITPKLLAALQVRYFDNPFQMRLRARPWVRSDLAKRITRWDKDLRRAEARYGVDWRLLAAVMMVESAQKRMAVSSVGAQGLFQFMPRTAKEIGLSDPNDPSAASLAAARYLRQLSRRFADASSPYDQRMMALASYNVGPGHVDDARLLAGSINLEPDSWDEGVSLSLPLLAHRQFNKEAKHGFCQGLIATRYAEQVSDLFEQYSQLLPKKLIDVDGGPEGP